jgi:hypothetical protein
MAWYSPILWTPVHVSASAIGGKLRGGGLEQPAPTFAAIGSLFEINREVGKGDASNAVVGRQCRAPA